MKLCFALLLSCSWCAWPQDDNVVATINGQKMMAGEFKRIVAVLDPALRQMAEKQPQQFLEQWAMFQIVLDEAAKNKIDQQSPYKEQLAEARRKILVQAQVDEKGKSVTVSPEERKKYFEDNRDRYFQAKVKVIFISRASQTRNAEGKVIGEIDPEQARAKADTVAKRARAGEDFVALAKETSDDPSTSTDKNADFPDPIRPNSANIPQNFRDAILSAKKGDIVGPIEHDTGFYLFRVESIGMLPYEDVKEEVLAEFRNKALREWVEETRKRATVKIEDPSFFAKPHGTM